MRTKLAFVILAALPVFAFVGLTRFFSGSEDTISVHVDVSPEHEANSAVSAEALFPQSYTLSADRALNVDLRDMALTIRTGNAVNGTAAVDVLVEGIDRLNAEELASLLKDHLLISTDGDRLTIREQRSSSCDTCEDLHVIVSTPTNTSVYAKTVDGSVTVDNLNADLEVRTTDGDINVSNVTGSRTSLGTTDGRIRVGNLTSDRLIIHATDGNLDLGRAASDSYTITTTDGNIRIGALSGEGELNTTDGTVEVGATMGSTLSIGTTEGNIRLGAVQTERLQIRSTSGTIEVGKLANENAITTTDGDVRLVLHNRLTRLNVQSLEGNIRVTAPAALADLMHLRASEITSDPAFGLRAVTSSNSNAPATLGLARSDDATVVLHSQDGSISLRRD